MRTALKVTVGIGVGIALLTSVASVWVQSLVKDQGPDGRPAYGTFTWPEPILPPRGGPTPRSDGFVVGSHGTAIFLEPMPPVRRWDIATAQNIAHNGAIRSCFFPSGKGRSGLFSTDPDDFSIDNQFPDTGTTYGLTSFQLPEGAKILLRGHFPHMRHWNFVTYSANGEPRDVINDDAIEPLPGNFNPFRPGVPRDVRSRAYELAIVSGEPPAQRPANTLYTRLPADTMVTLYMRNYVPDRSIDWTGGVGVPEMELHLADGRVLKGEAACAATNTEMRGRQLALTVKASTWLALNRLPWMNADRTPARPFEVTSFKRFFNRPHEMLDTFFPLLPNDFLARDAGGYFSNAATRYGLVYVSQSFGKVYLVRGILPSTPRTWEGQTAPLDTKADMRYWSLCSASAPPVGMTPDCVHDEVVRPVLDANGYYNVVVSRATERPVNATEECGVVWMELGNGDGVPGGSADYGALINRHTQVNPAFGQSWFAVTQPGTEAEVMGEYLPKVHNLRDKARFESLGCPVDLAKAVSGSE